jgi:hypothetical protein
MVRLEILCCKLPDLIAKKGPNHFCDKLSTAPKEFLLRGRRHLAAGGFEAA